MSDDTKSDDLPDTQPTDVAAAARAAGTSATRPIPVQSKKKRRRWPWVLGGILIVLVILLVVAFFVADAYAKDYARQYIKDRIVAVLGIEDPSQVTVDIGSGSVLLQAISRSSSNEVDVDAGTITFGALTGAATVHAEGVPLDANAATEQLDVTFTVAEDQIVDRGRQQPQRPSHRLHHARGARDPWRRRRSACSSSRSRSAWGSNRRPPTGRSSSRRRRISLFEESFTVEQASEQLGALADQLFAKQSICVDESLPVALTIVDVDVVQKTLVVKINGDGVVMGGTGSVDTGDLLGGVIVTESPAPDEHRPRRLIGGPPSPDSERREVYTAGELFADFDPVRPGQLRGHTRLRELPLVRRHRTRDTRRMPRRPSSGRCTMPTSPSISAGSSPIGASSG